MPPKSKLMAFSALLKISEWSKLGKNETVLNHEVRKNIVFSQVLILTLAGLVVHFIFDTGRGDYYVSAFVVLAAVVTIVSYRLNESKRHLFAKIFFLASFNTIFFVLASLVPRECAINLLYIPLLAISLIVNHQQDSKVSYTLACVSIVCLVILELTDYSVFGPSKILEKASLYNVLINIGSASFILFFSLVFLIRSNRIAEQKLLVREEQLTLVNRKLDRFIYATSHDLRSPLNSIKGLIQLASIDTDPESRKRYFAMMNDRTEKLDRFIMDVLDFSKSTKDEIAIQAISIEELVNEIASNLRYMEGAAKIELIKEFGEVDFINSDRKKLSTVLTNLIANSVKYHNYDQPHQWIKISLAKELRGISISVSDNGIGIAEDQQLRVFDMFHRASERSTGSGLGLFIVKETLARLNGNITLKSTVGKGTSFQITLPESVES